jgi:hypothetical protein
MPITDDNLIRLVEHTPNLKDLMLQSEFITDKGLNTIAKYAVLESVQLFDVKLVTDAGAKALETCKTLHSVVVRGSARLSDAAISAMSTLPNLRLLHLGGRETGFGSALALSSIKAKCPELESLHLEGPSSLSFDAISVLSSLPKLASLYLDCALELDASTLPKLLDLFRQSFRSLRVFFWKYPTSIPAWKVEKAHAVLEPGPPRESQLPLDTSLNEALITGVRELSRIKIASPNGPKRRDERARFTQEAHAIIRVIKLQEATERDYHNPSIHAQSTELENTLASFTIGKFFQTHFRRRRSNKWLDTYRKQIVKLQAMCRSFMARKITMIREVPGIVEKKKFLSTWRGVLRLMEKQDDCADVSWVQLKRNLDVYLEGEDANDDELLIREERADVKLDPADVTASGADGGGETLAQADELDSSDSANTNAAVPPRGEGIVDLVIAAQPSLEDEAAADALPEFKKVMWTNDMLKWFKRADERYRDLLKARLTQLDSGQRSHHLMKRLVGFEHPIFEAYLDNKVGFRILWTEFRATIGGSRFVGPLIWFVSSHDRVSRYASLIVDSLNRVTRQAKNKMYSWVNDGISMDLEPDSVLLDPKGNVPLKLYEFPRHDLYRVTDKEWTPALRMTSKEREVIEMDGSVLLLGRSGTGKTICVVNRMTHDRQITTVIGPFKQLFVARNRNICLLVKGLQEQEQNGSGVDLLKNTRFLRLEDLIGDLIKDSTPTGDNAEQHFSKLFNPAKQVGYRKFKEGFFPKVMKKCTIEPMIVWTQIRSFIKGSIIAAMQTSYLTLEQYQDTSIVPIDLCHLDSQQRAMAYSAFVEYEDYCKKQGWWDDVDRVFKAFELWLKPSEWKLFDSVGPDSKFFFHRVYVDEVQDYTQAELALLLMLCDANSLFLAGDTAQSVEEGVAFRFEDAKRVLYEVAKAKPPKPQKLCMNFRSHAGVLDVAAKVLDRLLIAFPKSIDKLEPDQGLFKGPRPTVLQVDGLDQLKELLIPNERLVVLTRDDNVEAVLPYAPKNLVMGIRDSKGLEHSDVALVDFFSGLERFSTSKALRDVLRTTYDLRGEYPEMEWELKMLYTAITRCQNRFVFVETKPTSSGSQFFRWLTDSHLAEQHPERRGETADLLMTNDEWRMKGIEFALRAEDANEVETIITRLETALACFERAVDTDLAKRVKLLLRATKFRQHHLSGDTIRAEIEAEAIQIVQECLREKALFEARRLCSHVVFFLAQPAQPIFMSRILNVLDGHLRQSTF